MSKVIFAQGSHDALIAYVHHYEIFQIERFRDSGIWWEEVIINSYHKRAKELFLTLYDHIIRRMSGDTVLEYRRDPENPWHATLITTIEDYTLIIDYFEDDMAQTRTIEVLRIFRG